MQSLITLTLLAALTACGGGGSEEPLDCAEWLAANPPPAGGMVGAGAAVWASHVPDHCWAETGFQP